jgi:hypothetical protein
LLERVLYPCPEGAAVGEGPGNGTGGTTATGGATTGGATTGGATTGGATTGGATTGGATVAGTAGPGASVRCRFKGIVPVGSMRCGCVIHAAASAIRP